ncbi:MAG: CopG family transcriptional regulator [Nostochopsis sp.]
MYVHLHISEQTKILGKYPVMMNKKWATKRITLNLASAEAEKLERYCRETGRPATDVIRELIRGLPIQLETDLNPLERNYSTTIGKSRI